MTWLVVVGLAFAIGVWLWFRTTRKPPLLTAIVQISEDGRTTVQLEGSSNPTDLGLLCVVYGSKVRWLLNSEPPELAEMFQELAGEVVDYWPTGTARVLDSSPMATHLRDTIPPGHGAVPGGEVFRIRLYRTGNGHAYVLNDLPRPGLAVNIPWHFFILLDEIVARLDTPARVRLRTAFDRTRTSWTDIASAQSMAKLREITARANAAWASAD